jgi:hypothetical protein
MKCGNCGAAEFFETEACCAESERLTISRLAIEVDYLRKNLAQVTNILGDERTEIGRLNAEIEKLCREAKFNGELAVRIGNQLDATIKRVNALTPKDDAGFDIDQNTGLHHSCWVYKYDEVQAALDGATASGEDCCYSKSGEERKRDIATKAICADAERRSKR